MKYSVTTVMLPEYSLEETAGLLGRLGFDGVEWRVRRLDEKLKDKPYGFWGNVKNDLNPDTLLSEAERIKKVCADNGLEIAALASYCEADQEDEVKLVAEGAAGCGSPLFRVRPPGSSYDPSIYCDYGTLFLVAVEAYGKVAEIAHQFGVKVVVEIHSHTLFPSATAAYRLVSNFSPKDIGVIYDVGNMAIEGYEQYRLGLELLGFYVAHVHAGNSYPRKKGTRPDGSVEWERVRCNLAEGLADYPRLMEELKRSVYTDFSSIEDFQPVPPEQREKNLAENLRYLKSLE